jgi:ATP-dependent Clp protease ATP-binding subunit ClpA
LSSSALDEHEIRTRLGFVQGRVEPSNSNGAALPLSPRTARVMLAADNERRKRGLDHIGTLHLLSAIIAERDGLAVFILEEPGVGLERLGMALQRAFREKWDDDEGLGTRD